jgi:hypothetical protein
MIEDIAMGWVMGRLIVGLIRSFKRFWYLWLAAFAAFLIYRHLTGAN